VVIAALALVVEPFHVLGKLVSVLDALVSIKPVDDPTWSRKAIFPFVPSIAIQ